MRLARRRPACYQLVGDVGRDRVSFKRRALHRRGNEAHGFPRTGKSAQRCDRVLRDRDRLALRHLQIALVGRRQSAERSQRTGIRSHQLGRMRAHQLERIGVALLRHQTRSGRRGITEPHVAIRRNRPGDELLGDARGIHDGAHACVREIERRVAIADRIERVAGRTCKAERLRRTVAIERQARACKRGTSQGARKSRRASDAREALGRAHKRFAPRHEHEGQEHRLRGLAMRAACEHRLRPALAGSPSDERRRDGVGTLRGGAGAVTHVEQQGRRNLIVAAAPGMQPFTGRAGKFSHARIDRAVDVLRTDCTRVGRERAGADLRFHSSQRGAQRRAL